MGLLAFSLHKNYAKHILFTLFKLFPSLEGGYTVSFWFSYIFKMKYNKLKQSGHLRSWQTTKG